MKVQTYGSSRQQHLHIPEEQAVKYKEDIARYAAMLLLSLQNGAKIKFKKPAGNHKRAKLKANLLVNYSLDQGTLISCNSQSCFHEVETVDKQAFGTSPTESTSWTLWWELISRA